MRPFALVLVLVLAVVPAAEAVDPTVVQARYDAARDREEMLLRSRSPDRAELARLRATIVAAERFDHRPAGWRGGRDVPRTPLPPGSRRARATAATDLVLERRLGALGQWYRGWAAFWVHDLRTGRTAGWNSDARFPAASTVKLAVVDAALRNYPGRGRRRIDYDLRQVGAWSSNLAANRLYALVGPAATDASLDRLGMHSSTYTGPYRAGTSFDAPKPPPLA